ncbi:probable tubulin polyglutamylase ttll-15 [Amphiura filiformis]|uniref:probable tubulin polyglutamylase ttll-15 n=1 Tax=Amphiura filiformis TaxID=82378 RepID=UPI003B21DFCE
MAIHHSRKVRANAKNKRRSQPSDNTTQTSTKQVLLERANIFLLLPRTYKSKICYIIALLDVWLCIQIILLWRDVDMRCSSQQVSQENFTKIPVRLKCLMHRSIVRNGEPCIKTVLSRIGYRYTTPDDNWDLLWTNIYPFNHDPKKRHPELELLTDVKNIPPESKANHFPGMGFLLNKMVLTTVQPSKYIPKTFVMPREKMHFLNQLKSARYRNQLWIEKSQTHRGNQVKEIKDLNLDQDILVQEFISDQYLICGHSFNIGAYVLLTSIEPLRFYINHHEFNHRIAPEKFLLMILMTPENISQMVTKKPSNMTRYVGNSHNIYGNNDDGKW